MFKQRKGSFKKFPYQSSCMEIPETIFSMFKDNDFITFVICPSRVVFRFAFCKFFLTLYKKMKFSIKGFFSECDQIRRELQNWPHFLKKSLIENFIFCAVSIIGQFPTLTKNCVKNNII